MMQGLAIDYQDGQSYFADLVAPIVKGEVSRRFVKFSRRDAGRLLDLKVDSKGQPKEASIDVSSDTYVEQGYGEIQKIANVDISDAVNIPDLFAHHQRALMYDLKRARENRVLTLAMAASSYASGCTSALSSTNRWDVTQATSTANPVNDIRITAGTAPGMARRFNTMLIGLPAWEYLRTHPKVIAAAGGSASDRVVGMEEMKVVFGLQNIFVSDVKYDTAGAAAAASYAFMAPKSCALIWTQPGASRNELSFMKTFRQHDLEFVDEMQQTPGVRGITILKGSHADAEKVVANDAGYLLDTVIS